MTDKHLDDAIDRAVREMMRVDADPGFRARVFARIERTPSRRLHWPRLAVGAAVTAGVALALLLGKSPAPTPAPSSPPLAHAPVASGPRAVQPPAAPSQLPGPPPGPAAAVRQRRAMPPSRPNVTQQVAAGAMVATVADPEASPEAGDASVAFIDPIRIPAIEPAPIVISPLAPLPPLRIAPLSPQIERD